VKARSRTGDGRGDAGVERDGFTIIEVLVAITILVIALLGAALLFENAIVVSGNTRNRVVAANLGTAAMESVRGMAADPAQFIDVPLGRTVITNGNLVNGIQYTVTQDITLTGQDSTTSSCDNPPGPGSGQVLKVVESVTWPAMGGTKPVTQVSTLAPPVGAYSTSTGSIGVKVSDSTSADEANVSVQVTGPDTQTQQTTSEGCAYFGYLDPGTYTVSIVSGTGVDDQEDTTPSHLVPLAVGQTVSLPLQYDNPATISATLPSPTNTPGAPPHPSGLSIGIANTGLQPSSQFTFAAAAGDTTTSPALFPYSNGYVVFAGNCTDNNPLGKDTSRNLFYPTAPTTPVNVDPYDVAVPATAPLYTLAVHVQSSLGPIANSTPTAAEASYPAPYTAVCTSGIGPGAAPTLGLVTLNATGDSVTGMPLGHWTVTATCLRNTPSCSTTRNLTGSVRVWVKPDGVYAVNSSKGASTTKFTGPITVVVS
jgi:prepilin-type N-terminal cleavage/methylation domain-containing protein